MKHRRTTILRSAITVAPAVALGLLACAVWLPAIVRAADVPHAESFDDANAGALHGQDGWQAQDPNNAQVQSATVYAGDQAVVVSTNTVVWQNFTNETASNVWVDFYAKVPHPTNDTAPDIQGRYAAAFYPDSSGKIHAISNSTWVTLNYTLTAGEWYRFTINMNYDTERWALHVSDATPNAMATPVATNLQFSTTSTNAYFHRFRIKN